MAVSSGEFDTNVAGITGCAAGSAPEIGGGGTLVRANSLPSAPCTRTPATEGSSDSIMLSSNTSRDALPGVSALASGLACTASCNKLSAAPLAAARAAASAGVVTGPSTEATAELNSSRLCGISGVLSGVSAFDSAISGANSGASAGDIVAGGSAPAVMTTDEAGTASS